MLAAISPVHVTMFIDDDVITVPRNYCITIAYICCNRLCIYVCVYVYVTEVISVLMLLGAQVVLE